jgi:hypothetical protein
LWQIDGVEHVYSVSRPGQSVVTVRFYVGEDRERSLVKLHNKIFMNQDQAPPLVKGWVIKPVEIDDVSIVNLTLHSASYDDHQLRRMAEEILWPAWPRCPTSAAPISWAADPGWCGWNWTPSAWPVRGDAHERAPGADGERTHHSRRAASTGPTRSYEVTSDSFLIQPPPGGPTGGGRAPGPAGVSADVAEVIDGPSEAASYTRLGFSRRYLKDQDPPGRFRKPGRGDPGIWPKSAAPTRWRWLTT